MTLKEFSATYLPVRDGRGETIWRKVFPTNLRWQDGKVLTPSKIIKGFFSAEYHVAKYERVLAEEWERVHMGAVIDREWRPVYEY